VHVGTVDDMTVLGTPYASAQFDLTEAEVSSMDGAVLPGYRRTASCHGSKPVLRSLRPKQQLTNNSTSASYRLDTLAPAFCLAVCLISSPLLVRPSPKRGALKKGYR
jgi:hypothetical protein